MDQDELDHQVEISGFFDGITKPGQFSQEEIDDYFTTESFVTMFNECDLSEEEMTDLKNEVTKRNNVNIHTVEDLDEIFEINDLEKTQKRIANGKCIKCGDQDANNRYNLLKEFEGIRYYYLCDECDIE